MNRQRVSFCIPATRWLPLALLLAMGAGPALADEGDKPAVHLAFADNPLVEGDTPNPLLEDEDPFLGVYKNETMTITVQTAKEGVLTGTVKKGERTFPLTAKREGQALKGYFTHNDSHFAFTATLEGKELHFTTSDRLFKLSREVQTKTVAPLPAPVPTPPQPAVPTPKPPAPQPAPQPTLKPIPQPTPKPEALPAEPVVPPLSTQAIPKGAVAKPGRCWSGFPLGTYVIMEETISSSSQIPVVKRVALVFQALDQDKEMVLSHQFNGTLWAPVNKPAPWLGNGKTVDDLGFKVEKSWTEAIDAAGTRINCTVTQYSGQTSRNGVRLASQLQIWTTKSFDHPSQPVILPEGVLRIEGGVIRVTRSGDDGTSLDYALATMNEDMTIGNTAIRASSFKGIGSATTPNGKIEVAIERWLSPQVPGGMAKLVIDSKVGGTTSRTTGKAVEIGLAKVVD